MAGRGGTWGSLPCSSSSSTHWARGRPVNSMVSRMFASVTCATATSTRRHCAVVGLTSQWKPQQTGQVVPWSIADVQTFESTR